MKTNLVNMFTIWQISEGLKGDPDAPDPSREARGNKNGTAPFLVLNR